MARKSKVLPETVGEDRPEDPIGDLIKKSYGHRGLPLAEASKRMGKVYKDSDIYNAKAPTVSKKARANAVKAKTKASSSPFYNRGQRVSQNVEDYTTNDGSASVTKYGDMAFFKHTIKDNKK